MSLEELRQKIDEIDSQIVQLLNRRARVAMDIGKIKEKENSRFFAPGREKEVLRSVVKRNEGPLPDKALEAIYREVISATRALEKPMTVTYLGPQATFTHMASKAIFGSSTRYVPANSITEVFATVEKETFDYGVVPIENSTEGVVNHTLDMLMDSELKICSEILLEISQHLLSNTSFSKITKVYSHPQAFPQCRRWLERNLPDVELVETSSTARAATTAAKEDGAAAIASELAAELYDLKVVAKKIEDNPENYTRFLVIGNEMPAMTGNDKTSVMFSIKDKVGALSETLQIFSSHQINLSKIESRPSRKKAWEYVFFVDMEGHCRDENVALALEELSEKTIFSKLLGSYPSSS